MKKIQLHKFVQFIIINVLLTYSLSFAALVSEDQAKQVALSQIKIMLQNQPDNNILIKNVESRKINEIRPILSNNGKILAFVAHLIPEGYIIIGPNTDVRPVISYSSYGRFSFEKSQENILLSLVINDMENRLHFKSRLSPEYIEKNNQKWISILFNEKIKKLKAPTSKQWGPYLVTQWNQRAPYNNYCPVDPETSVRSLTGCVATAVAQIINYWKYPLFKLRKENSCNIL